MNHTWVDSIKWILSYKLKVKNDPKQLITVKRIIDISEGILIKRYPKNMHLELSVFKTLQQLTRVGYLKKIRKGYKLNPKYQKPVKFKASKILKSKIGNVDLVFKNGVLIAKIHGWKIKLGGIE